MITPVAHCRVCKSKELNDLLSFGDIYLSDFTREDKKPAKYPLDLVLCPHCYLVQLKHNTPPALLYSENYGYKSGINQTMRDHLQGIAAQSLQKAGKKDHKVTCIDIGANDGTLLGYYPKDSTYRIAFEPVKKFKDECLHHADVVISDFFNYPAYKKQIGNTKADIVTAISCFYDMEEPNAFVSDVVSLLDEDGIFVIQQNYVKSMLEQNAFDNIVHEHLEYYSLLSLQNLLKRHGLEVFSVETNDLNGGSFRTYIAFAGKREIEISVKEMEEQEKKAKLATKDVYNAFAQRVKKEAEIATRFIKQAVSDGKTIYLYGASTRGNTLLQVYGIDHALIPYAVERNPEKWGKYIASVGIPIISEEEARKRKPDYLLVLPWFFKKEFLEREKSYLDAGGHFIFPLPHFEVV